MHIAFHIAAALLLIAFAVTTVLRRAVRINRRGIREKFAFRTVLQALTILGLTIFVTLPNYGYWDLLEPYIKIPESNGGYVPVRALGRAVIFVLAVIIVVIIMYRSIRTHKYWSNAKSERQFRRDSRGNWNSSFRHDIALFIADALIMVFAGKHKRELREHSYHTPPEQQATESDTTIPWYKEFAEIYPIIEPRFTISESSHWFADNNCFVFPFDADKHIAVLISDVIPSSDEQEIFTRFLKRLEYKYFKVIYAVKTNAGGNENLSIQKNGYDITIVFKEQLLDNLVNFTDYYEHIARKLSEPISSEISLSLNDVYTPLFCVESGKKDKFRIDAYIGNWLKENSRRQLALLGDYGQGKTTTALQLTHDLIRAGADRVPIYISLRGKSPRNNTSAEILGYFASQHRMNAQALEILNNNGRLLLIFDGFDEMDYIGDWSIRQLHFRNLWKLVKSSTKMIITGRPNYFFDIDEAASALGSNIQSGDIPHCTVIRLCAFNKEQISLVLSKTPEETRFGIESVLAKSPPKQFVDLISRPSNLSLVVQIWEPRNLAQKYKNLSAASVIDEFLQDSYERQMKRSNQRENNILSVVEREYFMLGIALKMYSEQTLEIDNQTLDETVMNLVDKFPDEISRRNPAIINLRSGKTVREYCAEAHTREAINTDIRTCGVLVLNEYKNRFEFAHKSFYDLLVAKCFWGKYLPNDNDYSVISRHVFAQFNVIIRKLRRDDASQKKLLAELLISEMNKAKDAESRNPVALFRQCYRLIVGSFYRRVLPQSEYRKYRSLTAEMDGDADFNNEWVSKISAAERHNERCRFLAIPLLLCAACIAFIISSIRIIGMYWPEAERAYSTTIQTNDAAPITNSNVISASVVWQVLPALVLVVAVVLLTAHFGKRFKRRYIESANVLFFTWYYALKELNIDDDEIMDCFKGTMRESFARYIETLEYGEIGDMPE
jgi:hypothetical protein